MKAGQLTGPRRLEMIQVPEPNLEDGQVLVRLQRVSICGSDLRTFAKVLPEESYPLDPGRPNHECAGVVVESRCAEYNPGQRVILFPTNSDGLAEYAVAPPSRLVPLPDEGALEHWVMCQPMGTVLYACSRMPNPIGKQVVVLGQGAIGLSFTTFLKGMNVQDLIVVDLLDYRLRAGKKQGATYTINAQRENVVDTVMELTQGKGADIVVEAAGEVETVNQAAHLVRQFGTIILFGLTYDDTFPVEFKPIHDRDVTLISTTSARAGAMPAFVRHTVHMVEQKRLDPSALVTHRMKLEDMQKAYTMYEERSDGIIKVVMDV